MLGTPHAAAAIALVLSCHASVAPLQECRAEELARHQAFDAFWCWSRVRRAGRNSMVAYKAERMELHPCVNDPTSRQAIMHLLTSGRSLNHISLAMTHAHCANELEEWRSDTS